MIDTGATVGTETQPEGTYWHFLAEDCRLGYYDGRKVVVGETLRMDETPILRKRGFHASRRAIDALSFARGPIVCLVTLGGIVLNETKQSVPDKSVAQERTVLWMYNASNLLRHFACDVAEEALLAEREAGREPDPRSFDAISVMRRFMTGDASETERNSAQSPAWEVAWSVAMNESKSAAYSAAYSTAYGEAWIAANRTARYAAWNAALNAKNNAALNATNNAAESAFNDRLTGMLLAAMARGEGDFPPSSAQELV